MMPKERLLFISSQHWVKYLFPSFLYVLLTAAGFSLLFGDIFFPVNAGVSMTLFFAGLVLLLCVHHWFFWFLLAESYADLIVTDQRVIYMHTGLLWDEDTVEVSFGKVKSVESHKKNLLQSVLNYGSLDFERKIQIDRVPHPGTLAKAIQQAMGMI